MFQVIYIIKVRSLDIDRKNQQEILKDIFKSWFIKELRDIKTSILDLRLLIELKKIEGELYIDETFEQILEKYKKFRGILIENNVL